MLVSTRTYAVWLRLAVVFGLAGIALIPALLRN
jgi:hypothetical protein